MGTLAALASALADQLPLKLRNRRQHGREQSPLRCGRVPQRIAQRLQRCVSGTDPLDQVHSSRVERPIRSSFVTITVSPALSEDMSLLR